MQSLHRSLRQRGGIIRTRLAGITIVRRSGFTLVELLTVMAIIAILAGLILSISGYATKKAALSRAQSEIQAISAGCESYKADNGTYPYQPVPVTNTPPYPSDLLDPRTNGNSTYSAGSVYANASLELYEALTSDTNCTGTSAAIGTKNYVAEMRPDVWGRINMSAPVSGSNQVEYVSDPFGNVYGYSTANSTTVTTGSSPVQGYSPPTSMPGYNPTFDLWSTGGSTLAPFTGASAGQPGDPALGWAKNW